VGAGHDLDKLLQDERWSRTLAGPDGSPLTIRMRQSAMYWMEMEESLSMPVVNQIHPGWTPTLHHD